MDVTRREFMRITAAGAAGLATSCLGFDLAPVKSHAQMLKTKYARETTTICCYCAVGCGVIVHTSKGGDGRVINIEGDPEHVINRGALCSKGASLRQLVENEKRLLDPMYRAPYSRQWKTVSWEWALSEIAKRIQTTRDADFVHKNTKGQVVNRTNVIASVGSAAMNNEEGWLYNALMRALGLVYIEHQARLCHSATIAALAESFGRGAMTNHWIDIKNSDCIMIIGSNAAENHPISFKYVGEAMQNGATLISVDPRFTRTSSKADIFAQIRAGTDLAFLGGMLKYILENDRYNKEYVAAYTNAPFIVGQAFTFENGLFAGYDAKKRSYHNKSWVFEMEKEGVPKMDRTLEHERCVLKLLKKHFNRYDIKTVAKITGISETDCELIYKTYALSGQKGKAGTIMYAMGGTQHTVGTQNVRAMAIIQLLLANMGVAGGGLNALGGESNVQGATDHALLWHLWPGYLKVPHASSPSLAAYNEKWTPKSKEPLSANEWRNYAGYSVSLLKSFFGDTAVKADDFGYEWLPKVDDGVHYSWLDLFDDMFKGTLKGFFAWGQNPACSGSNAGKVREALKKLDWMVNVSLFDNETGSFWNGPGEKPSLIKTEVFMLPACTSVEKEGSITNSGRWMQWRYQGPKPLGNSRADGDIIMELGTKIKELYAQGGKFPEPILNLKWDYSANGRYDAHKVAKQINGYFLKDVTVKGQNFREGTLVPGFAYLSADGSTSCGNWLYCNSYTEEGNMATRRSQEDAPNKIGLYPRFSWCWPVNRRIIYNRAAVDLQGQPWDKNHWVIKWNGNRWAGDVPDGSRPPLESLETPSPESMWPFIMREHGHAQIFGPGLAEGPFPEHYEPLESPLNKNLLNPQRINPVAAIYAAQADAWATCDSQYPCVGTTFRVGEHWQSGLMTRTQPWLLELQPQVFVELSQELAQLSGIKNGERVRATSARGSLVCTAIISKRIKPLKIAGKTVHQVGFAWNFGWRWPRNRLEDSANLLTSSAADANTRIPETKAFMCNLQKINQEGNLDG